MLYFLFIMIYLHYYPLLLLFRVANRNQHTFFIYTLSETLIYQHNLNYLNPKNMKITLKNAFPPQKTTPNLTPPHHPMPCVFLNPVVQYRAAWGGRPCETRG